MGIDWTLLLLVVVAIIAVIGLILALQSTSGRKRLADGALRLAESLIALAIRWLERTLPGEPVAGVAPMMGDIDRARAAQAALKR